MNEQEIKIGNFIITNEKNLIVIYNSEESAVCFFDKSDVDDIINFLIKSEQVDNG